MTPQLRFPEFTDVWQVRKLGDITQINPRVGSLPDVFVYIDLDSVKRGTLLKQNRISKIGSPSRAQRLLSRDDIIYQTVRPYQKNNFYFDKAGDYVASTGYAQIRAREGYYSRFVYTLLHTSTFVNKVLVRSTGTNYPAINSNDLAKVKVHTPSKPEQEKIADFLTAVDERIGVSEKKLELLETYKRGVMQKIFSQQVRFKDENGNPYPDWEEKKLGDSIEKNKKRNKNLAVNYVQSVSNKHGFVSQDEYFDGANIASKNTSNYFVIEKGTFAYNPSRINVGSLAYKTDTETSIVSPLYVSFKTKNDLENKFLLPWFSTLSFTKQMHRAFEGSVRDTLSYEALSGMKIAVPCKEEQQKIADFLTTLDEKITAEKSKLTAAREFKKALLQRMFV